MSSLEPSELLQFDKATKTLKNIEEASRKLRMQLSELETYATLGLDVEEIVSGEHLSEILKKRQKGDGVDLEMLSLQTEISPTTLKRMFKDVSSTKFDSVRILAQELGLKLCIAK